MSDLNQFHAKDGWYFKRTEDGGVGIWSKNDDVMVVLDAATWASIVAHVSAQGGIAETFQRAQVLHESADTEVRE